MTDLRLRKAAVRDVFISKYLVSVGEHSRDIISSRLISKAVQKRNARHHLESLEKQVTNNRQSKLYMQRNQILLIWYNSWKTDNR